MRFTRTQLNEDIIRLVLICLILVIIYLFILTPLHLNLKGRSFFQDLVTNYAYRFIYHNAVHPEITIIAIDDATLKQENLRWPWPRAKFAELIDRTAAQGPKVLALDMAFVGKSNFGSEDDELLSKSIRGAGNVVLASYIGPNKDLVIPPEAVAGEGIDVGFVNKARDRESTVRRALCAAFIRGKAEYSFEAMAASLFKGLTVSDLNISGNNLIIGDDKIRLGRDGAFPIKFTLTGDNLNVISASDIFNGDFDKALLKDKIAVVGTTAIITHDIHRTPLGPMPGVFIDANTLANIIDKDLLHAPAPYVFFIVLMIITILAALAGLRYSAILSFTVTTTMALALSLIAALAFKANIEPDLFGMVILLYLSLGSCRLYLYIKTQIENSRMLRLLIIDRESGLYNLYYLLIMLQKELDTVKSGRRAPAMVMAEVALRDTPLERVSAGSKKALINNMASIIKKEVGRFKALVTRTGEFEFGIMLSRPAEGIVEALSQSLYQRIGNVELLLPEKNERFNTSVAIGIAKSADIEECSAQLVVYAAQEALNKAKESNGKKINIFDAHREKISSVKRRHLSHAADRGLIDYIIEDIKNKNGQLIDSIKALKEEIAGLKNSSLSLTYSLVKALEEKDIYTAGHSERVAAYSSDLAGDIGLSTPEIETINKAALLHDIGKIAVPDNILHKKGALNDDERELIKRHEIDSADILKPAEFLKDCIPIILHHHEHYDGSGYPHGLAGERIPIGSRVIAVADSYDAMTSGRGYNKPLNTNEAIEALKKASGTQFDPALVERFIELIKKESTI